MKTQAPRKGSTLSSHEQTWEFATALELQAAVNRFPSIRGTGEQRGALRRAVHRIAHALAEAELLATAEEAVRPYTIALQRCRKAIVSLKLLESDGVGSPEQHSEARLLLLRLWRFLEARIDQPTGRLPDRQDEGDRIPGAEAPSGVDQTPDPIGEPARMREPDVPEVHDGG
jgi:hypothetical protein